MNGEIKWNLSIGGMDEAIRKLTQIVNLIKVIQSSQPGTNNFNINQNNGVNGNNNTSNSRGGYNPGSLLEAGVFASALSGGRTSKPGTLHNDRLKDILLKNQANVIEGKKSDFSLKEIKMVENAIKEMWALNTARATGTAGEAQYGSPIGPPKPNIFQGAEMSLTKDFKSGSHALSKALTSTISGGGFSGLTSALSGVFGKLFPIIGGVTAAFYILTKSVKMLSEAIEDGAKAYRLSAQTGLQVGTSSNISSAFKALGISGKETDMMNSYAIRSQLGKGNDADVILNGAKSGQFGDQSALLNMAEEFKDTMMASQFSAKEMEKAAKANQLLSAGGSVLGSEWKTLMAQITAAAYPLIRGFELFAEILLKMFNAIMAVILWLEQHGFGIVPQGGTDKLKKQMFGGATSPLGNYESMGLVFGSGAGDHLKDISENTKTTSGYLKDLIMLAKFGAAVTTFAP